MKSNGAAWFAAIFVGALSLSSLADLGGDDGVFVPFVGQLELDGTAVDDEVTLRFSVYNAVSGGVACQTLDVLAGVDAGAFAVAVGPLHESCIADVDVFFEMAVDAENDGTFEALSGRTQVHPALGAVTSGDGDFVSNGVRIYENARILGGNGSGNLHIDADSQMYLNYYSGSAVRFGNGSGGVVLTIDADGDLTTSGALEADTVNAPALNTAAVSGSENAYGNLHLDGDDTKTGGYIYMNYFAGRGVRIGDGANSVVTTLGTDGSISSSMFKTTQLFQLASIGTDGSVSANLTTSGGTVVFHVTGSAYRNDGDDPNVGYNLVVAGADQGTVLHQYQNAASQHQSMSGTQVVSGLAAGTHSVVLQRVAGRSDNNDKATIVAVEYPF